MKNKISAQMVAIFALALVIAASLLFAVPATLSYGQEGGYGVTGGGGGSGGLPAGYSSLREDSDSNGVLYRDVTTKSSDELCQLTITKGTKALNSSGYRLASIFMVTTRTIPTLPENTSAVGLTYDITPRGATFDPAINITFTYDPADIPQGVNEENLVIAYWDGANWFNLEGPFTRDVENNNISAPISHFTVFTVMALMNPAAFSASNLTISPATVNAGQDITVGVTITNTGDLADSHEVTLKIDNKVISSKMVTTAGRASQIVTFSTPANYAVGAHTISINGLSVTFTVREPAPPPTPKPAPVPTPTPAPTPINWWLIGSIIAIVIIAVIATWLLIARRRYG